LPPPITARNRAQEIVVDLDRPGGFGALGDRVEALSDPQGTIEP
jgi:hypothetical protein